MVAQHDPILDPKVGITETYPIVTDEYLDELVEYLYREGVRAMTYMPTRNTKEQIVRLRALCSKYGMFQVSGEDINSPRQSFICRAMDDPMFSDLIDSTWALIKHELGKKKIML